MARIVEKRAEKTELLREIHGFESAQLQSEITVLEREITEKQRFEEVSVAPPLAE